MKPQQELHSNRTGSKRRYCRRGSALAIISVLLVALLGFLGLAIYTGLNAYLQNELQNAASAAAGAGATAFYDTFDVNGRPVKSPANAQQAAQDTFDNIVTANASLSAFNAQLINGTPTVDAGRDTVTINARAQVPTPFFAPLGIPNFNIESNSTARYARMNVDTSALTINTLTGPYYQIMGIDPPIVDGPGPDIFIGTGTSGGGYHGVMVELCSNGKCYDIGRAARLADNTGIVADRNYPGGPRRVLYGNFYIDLGAVAGFQGYNKHVRKGATIRVVDDGVHDYITTDGTKQRGMELIPQPTDVDALRIFHYAIFCADANSCIPPSSFEFTGG